MITTPLTTLLLFLSYHRCRDKDQVFRNKSLQVNWGVHWSVADSSSRKVQPWSYVLCIVWYSNCWSRKLWNCVTALCITLCLPYIWAENWITTSSSFMVSEQAEEKLSYSSLPLYPHPTLVFWLKIQAAWEFGSESSFLYCPTVWLWVCDLPSVLICEREMIVLIWLDYSKDYMN